MDFLGFDPKDPRGSFTNPRQQTTKIKNLENYEKELSKTPNESF